MPSQEGEAGPSSSMLLDLFAPPLTALPLGKQDQSSAADALVQQQEPATRENSPTKSGTTNDAAIPITPDSRRRFGIFSPSPSRFSINDERTSLLLDQKSSSSSLQSLFDADAKTTATTPKTGAFRNGAAVGLEERRSRMNLSADLPAIEEVVPIQKQQGFSSSTNKKRRNILPSMASYVSIGKQVKGALWYAASECASPSTWIGAFMFLLFTLVFSLTFGATITRPHGATPMLGLVSKMAALGIMMGAPIYWWNLRDVPALYPTVDLFAAPFLAKIAVIIDEELFQDPAVSDAENDQVFLGTFSFLASLSLFLSGSMMVSASVFKLANLGAFLPFPVLCGFFTAAGCLTWTLAFKVDTNGLTVSQVFLSGDSDLILMSLAHHAPSVVVAAIMKYMGPKHPVYVVMSVLSTIALFYITMFIFGISMDEMIERNWFWSTSDLHYKPLEEQVKVSVWATPAPFGWIHALVGAKVHWGAVAKGLETTVALSFLYLIRCSLHGAALKKNVPMLSRVEKVKADAPRPTAYSSRHQRRFSEVIDIENEHSEPSSTPEANATIVVTAQPTHASLKQILYQYGHSQYICSLVGGFGIIPCVATAPTMFMLGAEKLAPQVGSVLLLSVFYFTDYQLAGFIPKPAFSSLLVLAFIDMMSNWFVKSYFKTEEKLEWLVVPLIVVLAFVVGLLQAVLLGFAMSMFLFVASFYRSGVVKYVSNGVNVRSTIERSPKVSRWLDKSAVQIQILVMQNFLFFGNASSLNSYITTMFAEPDDSVDPIFVTPCPKFLVVDLTLVTGMDTSAVDAFSDILAVCSNNNCKLFLSGVSPRLQKVMSLCGVKPDNNIDRSQRRLRFFPGLDAAIGKAEDMLIECESFEEENTYPVDAASGDGFLRALYHIDEQHETTFANDLSDLQTYTTAIDVAPGNALYEDHNLERALFFIEHGVMKIERSSDATLSRAGSKTFCRCSQNAGTFKSSGIYSQHGPQFRIARVGPGWVIGSVEALSGATNLGSVVAVTQCRLHYISYKKVEAIESKDPRLVLKLYKLLSYLMTKRQEVTISQLGTLHSIMSAPARKKPIDRWSSSSFYG